MTQFEFLHGFDEVGAAVRQAESLARPDPRTACFHARRALELVLTWAYKHDGRLKLPYNDNLSALIHEPTFMNVAGRAVFNKARVLTRLGNDAVHGSTTIREEDGVAAIRELWHVCYWLASTYSSDPPGQLQFDWTLLPDEAAVPRKTADQLAELQRSIEERDERLSAVLSDKENLDTELKRLRKEIAEIRALNEAAPVDHDYNEQHTRDYFIDLLLKEAGWSIDRKGIDTEYEVEGMPNNKGLGFVDYVLWGEDGKPLGLVEAKRTRRDAREGQRQAELYADCLEKKFGQRPVIFYSNGYDHWLWDDQNYPPRAVQGFYTREELQLLIQRRQTKRSLAKAAINEKIVERPYQHRAIRRITESFETDKRRKALLVMATGTGKTRTTIALADVLMKANWAKRILFLADRVALVNQAVNAFKQHLPSATTVNLVTEKDTDGRVYVSTYPTIMGLIDEVKEGRRRFGVAHFDLVVIDEAHRSVFKKYKAIFEYFDAPLVGLTATPKDEVDRNTYRLFDLEEGVPTDAYGLDEAIADGYLVPPKAVSVPVRIVREGLRYDELSDEEKEQWEELPWDDDEEIPDSVDPAAINKRLFNKDTVDKVLADVMTNGIKVAGGDRLAKTILFAKNQRHAEFIEERFNANYPHLMGRFARTITFKTEYAQSLIDAFSVADRDPVLAISVDMLDTGIDIPEVCNLVFFKIIRSKTKFWQMIGRGTRLCPDLLGPGKDKQEFHIFDYCGNLEFFGQDMPETGGAAPASLKAKMFRARLELVQAFDAETEAGGSGFAELREEFAGSLREEVAAMNTDNFVVRPKRRLVEEFAKDEAWGQLDREKAAEVSRELADLPTELPADGEDAKRFDYLLLTLELASLRDDPGYQRLADRLKAMAENLEEKETIPAVARHIELILALQTDEWWQDVTIQMLESVRRRLRTIIHLIDKHERTPLYTDFMDDIGMSTVYELPGTAGEVNFERFRQKVRHALRGMDEDVVVQSLRRGEALGPDDLEHLEDLLRDLANGKEDLLEQAKKQSDGLAGFVRRVVGLSREAAKAEFADFLSGQNLKAVQIEFVNMIVNYLCEHGTIELATLYDSPFTDIAPQGPEAIFSEDQITALEACIAGRTG